MDTTRLVALIVLITFAVIGITRTVQTLRGRRLGNNRSDRLNVQGQNKDSRSDPQNQNMPVAGAFLWDANQAQEQHHQHHDNSMQHHVPPPVHHAPPPIPPVHHMPPPPPMHH